MFSRITPDRPRCRLIPPPLKQEHIKSHSPHVIEASLCQRAAEWCFSSSYGERCCVSSPMIVFTFCYSTASYTLTLRKVRLNWCALSRECDWREQGGLKVNANDIESGDTCNFVRITQCHQSNRSTWRPLIVRLTSRLLHLTPSHILSRLQSRAFSTSRSPLVLVCVVCVCVFVCVCNGSSWMLSLTSRLLCS